MIRAIFFSRFHPEKGPVVFHQVPDGSIIPTSSSLSPPLFDFSSISDYVIPKQEFCGDLVSVCVNNFRIIGYPVCVVDPSKYDRNEYIFNFSLVIDGNTGTDGYQDVVRMLASLFQDLETQESLLSSEKLRYVDGNMSEHGLIGGRVFAICEMVLEDLNNYCEFMMPIGMSAQGKKSSLAVNLINFYRCEDDRNTLNMKLFPTYIPPNSVRPWHVPLSTARLSSLLDTSWDLTISRIVSSINGSNSVATISRCSGVAMEVTCNGIAHLQYYGCLLLLDIFQYSALYAPTAKIGIIFSDYVLQDECARYVTITSFEADRARILQLYANLRHGMSLKAWCAENRAFLTGIDVRRLITFGIIKGFVYRVHKYALDTGPAGSERRAFEAPNKGHPADVETSGPVPRDHPFERYLDGMHSFDEICTQEHMSEAAVMRELKKFSDVQIMYR